MFNFQQVDYWIIKAKTIEISIYLQVVLSLFASFFVCLKKLSFIISLIFWIGISWFSVLLRQDNRVLHSPHISFYDNKH